MQAAGCGNTTNTAAQLFEGRGSREIHFCFFKPSTKLKGNKSEFFLLVLLLPSLQKGGLQQKFACPGSKQTVSPSLAPAWQFCHPGSMGVEKHGVENPAWLWMSQVKVYSQARRPKLEHAQGPE